MKNLEVITLVDGGINNLTAHSLDVAHAYKLVKLKGELKKAYNKFREDYTALLGEVGIDDPNVFDSRLEELNKKGKRTKAEEEELVDLNKKLERLFGLRNALSNEDVVLEGVKTMPYEEWFKLQTENKDITITIGDKSLCLLTLAEPVLENILWVAPEE